MAFNLGQYSCLCVPSVRVLGMYLHTQLKHERSRMQSFMLCEMFAEGGQDGLASRDIFAECLQQLSSSAGLSAVAANARSSVHASHSAVASLGRGVPGSE